MRFGSVCSGIEAASMAWSVLGWEAAFFSEIEPFPSAVLAHHYPHVPNHGDMTRYQEWPDEPIDLLVGGTPCQSFSVAGLRAGLADPRGNLMLTYLAIVAKRRPEWVVWENVPGVLSSNGGRDFGTFLRGLVELGYGFAYRVLDAQFCRAHGYSRAVPQRRRRVFVVGHSRDWRRAAAVLFDAASLRGDSPPRREAGQRVAPTISSRPTGGGGLGTDFGLDGGLVANSGDVGYCLTASAQQSLDAETETLVAHAAPAITRNPYGDNESREGLLIAHALRAEGFDASEDGTGRGTPIPVPVVEFDVAGTMMSYAKSGGDSNRIDNAASGYMVPISQPVPIDMRQASRGATMTNNRAEGSSGGAPGTGIGEPGDPSPTIASSHVPAVAFDMRGREDGAQLEGPHDTANIRAATGGSSRSYVAESWAVRRLTPRECERLQGFPDDFTAIPYRNKPAADGPRYKALGNSMAVNVMRVIGTRIALINAIWEAA